MSSYLGSLLTDGILRLSDYGYYSAVALRNGMPPWRLGALRHAANLVHALPGLDTSRPINVIDVGAHRGAWAEACARAFPKARILSFEPVAEFSEGAQALAKKYPNWRVLPIALGDSPGELQMEIRGQRSSFRRLAGDEFEDWRIGNESLARKEKVEVKTLDQVLAAMDYYPVDLLKIDAEGYEGEILRGAVETLKKTKQILIEVRFYPLFESGSVFPDIHAFLTEQGFELFHLKPCKGQCLWADALYVQRSGNGNHAR